MPIPGYGPGGVWNPAGSPQDWQGQSPARVVLPSAPFMDAFGFQGLPFPLFPTIFEEEESLKVKEG